MLWILPSEWIPRLRWSSAKLWDAVCAMSCLYFRTALSVRRLAFLAYRMCSICLSLVRAVLFSALRNRVQYHIYMIRPSSFILVFFYLSRVSPGLPSGHCHPARLIANASVWLKVFENWYLELIAVFLMGFSSPFIFLTAMLVHMETAVFQRSALSYLLSWLPMEVSISAAMACFPCTSCLPVSLSFISFTTCRTLNLPWFISILSGVIP